MHSLNFYFWNFLISKIVQYMNRQPTLEQIREVYNKLEKLSIKSNKYATSQSIDTLSIKGEWITPNHGKTETTLLYLHGGAYVFGSIPTYHRFLSYLAHHGNMRIFALDYRLAPEHPFPAALEDALNAYKWLLDNKTDPKNLVVAGDSAGGGLTLALVQSIRNERLPQAAAAICMAPWLDLSPDAPYSAEIEKKDKIVNVTMNKKFVPCYAGNEDLHNPLISPMYADLTDFPPVFIQTGTADSLSTQNIEFEKRARQEGSPITFEFWDGMPHVWQILFIPYVKESRLAVQSIFKFIENQLKRR